MTENQTSMQTRSLPGGTIAATLLALMVVAVPAATAQVLPEECEFLADSADEAGPDECGAWILAGIPREVHVDCTSTDAYAEAKGNDQSTSAGMGGRTTSADGWESADGLHSWASAEGDGGGQARAKSGHLEIFCDYVVDDTLVECLRERALADCA